LYFYSHILNIDAKIYNFREYLRIFERFFIFFIDSLQQHSFHNLRNRLMLRHYAPAGENTHLHDIKQKVINKVCQC